MTRDTFDGRSALVTGAASGIGLELSRALVARGTRVWLTDVNADAARAASAAIGDGSTSLALDVRDADAFASVAQEVAAESGGLDFLFNNAGIGVSGEMHELGVSHFDRIIDINVRGVMNGIAAVYPAMVERGRGHIVNTASAGGLLPMPLATPYAMTKHAVVGLSTSLRLEAEVHGVRVSALCPAAVETPLLDAKNPTDLPGVWRPDMRAYLAKLAGPPHPCERFVEYALDAVAANRSIVVAPATARVGALLQRLVPGLIRARSRRALQEERATR